MPRHAGPIDPIDRIAHAALLSLRAGILAAGFATGKGLSL